MRRSPQSERIGAGFVRSPKLTKKQASTTIPADEADERYKKAYSSAYGEFQVISTALASRTREAVSRIKSMPSKSTAAKAVCQLIFIPITTVKAKKAFKPIPGARAKG